MSFRLSFTALALSLAALLGACSEDAAAPASGGGPGGGAGRTPTVIAQNVAFVAQERAIEAVGTARARQSATLYPAVGGEVTAVLFAAGDFAKAGTALIELDARQEKLDVSLAKVSVDEARQLLERYRRIEDTGAISDSQIDEAKTALDGARIRLEQAEVALADRTVRAPFDGFVGLPAIDAGARITPTTVITQIDDRRTLFVDFPAPEDVFSALSPGKSVTAVPFAQPDVSLAAVLGSVDSQINRESRTFTARAVLDNANDTLRPGMSFRMSFTVKGREWPAVPEAAIVWGSDGAHVWAVEDGKAKRLPLGIIARAKGYVLVDAALARGSVIVAEGVQKVRDGMPVKVSETRLPVGPARDDARQDKKVAR
ncbi:MAG: efflux RND transporter periplasmic adaptor subunit [Pseudomonadota bacterium]